MCVEKQSGSNYQINYETHNAKGYWEWEGESVKYDWEIFAQPGSYDDLGTFNIDNNVMGYLEDYIEYYIEDRYDLDCEDGCIIPIKFTSNVDNQNIVINNVSINYRSGPSWPSETKIYDLSQSPSEVNMNFSRLKLEKANFHAPTKHGFHTFLLKLDGKK